MLDWIRCMSWKNRSESRPPIVQQRGTSSQGGERKQITSYHISIRNVVRLWPSTIFKPKQRRIFSITSHFVSKHLPNDMLQYILVFCKVCDKTFRALIWILRTLVGRRTGPPKVGPFRRTTSVAKIHIRAVKIITYAYKGMCLSLRRPAKAKSGEQ